MHAQEILLLERQNTQLQDALTRMSATANRAAVWARELESQLDAKAGALLSVTVPNCCYRVCVLICDGVYNDVCECMCGGVCVCAAEPGKGLVRLALCRL